MPMETDDIFTAITRYKKPENQFTASLVYLLRYLYMKSKDNKDNKVLWNNYCDFLSKLCGTTHIKWNSNLVFNLQEPEKRDEDGKEGIIDFEIGCLGSVLVGFEVKDTAPLDPDKLKQYGDSLKSKAQKEGFSDSKVVLLRHYYISQDKIKDAAHDIRWSELYVLLKEISPHFKEVGVSDYLLKEFLKYMEQKGVPPVDKINKDHLKGFQSLFNLLLLVRQESEGIFKDCSLRGTDFNREEDDEGKKFDYVSFDFRHNKSNAYKVEVYSPDYNDPGSDSFWIGLVTKSEWLEKSEGKLLDLKLASGDKDFQIDEKGLYISKPLGSVFDKETVGEQQDMIGKLLKEMYNKLETIKRPIHAGATRRKK